jgi:succinate dehydrogenase/fumarate reductase flavoprotein subunit
VTTPSPAQSLTADVVVVGAGAGGLSTAVTAAHHGLRVVVLERADVCGGATAWSGGWMWAPGNPLAHADGVHEDVEEFRTYLRAVLGADYDYARVDAFLAAAPEMVRFFHERTALTFVPGATINDVYGDRPGAGTTLGESAGGRLRTDLHSPAAWCPVSLVPYRSGRTGTFPHIMDRAKPGSIGVLSTGRRFVNEANGYHDYVTAMIAAAPEGEPVQSWQIADARFVRRFPLGMAKPLPVPLFPYLRSGYLKKGRTLEELARACGIDPAGLAATVAEFNRNARRGEDPEFGRGSTPFNRYGGDPTVGPNPSLRPLEKGPFYAVRVVPGSFGTFAGLATDARARVLDAADAPVPGLYAVGNDQASVMGGHYPAGGINIGPAMAFGFIAARDLAGVGTSAEITVSQA